MKRKQKKWSCRNNQIMCFNLILWCLRWLRSIFRLFMDFSLFLSAEWVSQILPGQPGPYWTAGEPHWQVESSFLLIYNNKSFLFYFRATFQASRTSCLRERRQRASSSTTLSSRRSLSRWWTSGGRGPRGRSGFSVLTGSRRYSSWCRRPSTTRYGSDGATLMWTFQRRLSLTLIKVNSTQSCLCSSWGEFVTSAVAPVQVSSLMMMIESLTGSEINLKKPKQITRVFLWFQVLMEDRRTNRLVESMNIFETIVNNKLFLNVSIILFLNKTDLLVEKIRTVDIRKNFPEFRGDPRRLEDVQVNTGFTVSLIRHQLSVLLYFYCFCCKLVRHVFFYLFNTTWGQARVHPPAHIHYSNAQYLNNVHSTAAVRLFRWRKYKLIIIIIIILIKCEQN